MEGQIARIALLVATVWDDLASTYHNDRVISQNCAQIVCNRCSLAGRPSSAAVTEMRRLRTYAAPNIGVEQDYIYAANDLRLRSCAGRS
jgi:hypothetical protein